MSFFYFVGSMIMDKEKHRDIKYYNDPAEIAKSVNDSRFQKLTELDCEVVEMESKKKRIHLNLPIQLGYFILQYAKLRMLQWYYDCLLYYVDRSDFEYIEMDTDSAYFAISGSNLADVVKSEMKEEFEKELYDNCQNEAQVPWFPRKCCQTHQKHDRRTVGLFKLEAEGSEMIALCSKTYLLQQSDGCKMSCKGIQKNALNAPMDIFHHVLTTKKTISKTNIGFRTRENSMWTYQQDRAGFSYTYVKRRVCDDGIHTLPLEIVLCPWPRANQNEFHIFKESPLHWCTNGIKEKIENSHEPVSNTELLEFLNKIPQLKELLKSTEEKQLYLVDEDKIYGCGFHEKLHPLLPASKHRGRNEYGLALMKLRCA